jgi:hypothetical protein
MSPPARSAGPPAHICNSYFELPTAASASPPQPPKSMDGIFSMDIDKSPSPAHRVPRHVPVHPTPERSFSAPSVHPASSSSAQDDRKAQAILLKQYLLSPSASASSPSPAPRAPKSHFQAGPPLSPSPTRANRNHPPTRPAYGHSQPYGQNARSPVNQFKGFTPGTQPPSPLAIKSSSFNGPSYGPAPRSGQHYRSPSQPKKSILETKLEAARAPATLPARSVIDMENEMRRVLKLDSYAPEPSRHSGGVLI